MVTLLFIAALTVVNFIGITESVVINMIMAFVEIAGLIIVMVIAIWYVAQGHADFGVLTEFDTGGTNWALAILAGVALSFFAMTGFENTANVAEETIDPHKSFPRSLIGGMVTAGVVYVLVSMAAALTVPVDDLAGSEAALLEVVKTGILPIDTGFMTTLFSVIAMVAITNTTLVAVVTQPRILYGMANEDVVPGVFAKIHASRRSPWVGLIFSAVVVAGLLVVGTYAPKVEGESLVERLALVTVLFLLFIYALVIVSCLKLRGQDEDERTFRANTPLLLVGLVGNLAILGWSVYDDPTSLYWCAGLLAIGVVLFLVEYFFGSRTRAAGAERPAGKVAQEGQRVKRQRRDEDPAQQRPAQQRVQLLPGQVRLARQPWPLADEGDKTARHQDGQRPALVHRHRQKPPHHRPRPPVGGHDIGGDRHQPRRRCSQASSRPTSSSRRVSSSISCTASARKASVSRSVAISFGTPRARR